MYEIKIARVVTFKLEPQIDSQNNVNMALLLKNHFFIMRSNNTLIISGNPKQKKIEN